MSSVPGLRRALFAAGLLLLLVLSACEQEATPLPSILPTLPPTATEGAPNATPTPVRYAVAPSALPYLTDEDRSLIAASAEIIALDAPPVAADLGTRYDLVVAVGEALPDGTAAPMPLQISLLMDITLAPLDDMNLAQFLYRAIEPAQITTALGIPGTIIPPTPMTVVYHEALANAGYPDGFDITLSSPLTPPAEALERLLAVYGVEVRRVAAGESAPLIVTTSPTTEIPPFKPIVLYTLPISYRAADGLTITFTPSGFPVARR